MFKKKNPCIKHKLWGELKREAHTYYRIAPHTNCSKYKIEYWCVDEYLCSDTPGISSYLTLDNAKKIIEKKREERFERLCLQALYYRRLSKLKNL